MSVLYYYIIDMRVKKDKAYIIVTVDKERVFGAFPFTEEGRKDAETYVEKLSKKDKQREYRVKIG